MFDVVERIVWQAPGGSPFILDGRDGIFALPAPTGRGLPPVQLSTMVVPGSSGAVLNDVRHGVRVVGVPVAVIGYDFREARDRFRSFIRGLDPVRVAGEPGTLRFHLADDDVRELVCYCTGDGRLDESRSDPDSTSFVFVAEFTALDPYFYDATDRTEMWGVGGSSTFFPFLPLRIGASEVGLETAIVNTGDVAAWPVWTITGPGEGIVLANDTTGTAIVLATVLDDGDTLLIDTRPGRKSIRDGTGANRFADRTPGSTLWPLVPGDNLLRLELVGASIASELQIAYRRGWLSA